MFKPKLNKHVLWSIICIKPRPYLENVLAIDANATHSLIIFSDALQFIVVKRVYEFSDKNKATLSR